jgi:hypothetical protein
MSRLRTLPFLAVLVLSPTATPQQAFVLDQSQSNFTFSGTSTLGPIVGNPSNAFALTGTIDLLLVPGGSQPSTSGNFAGGDALAVPDMHAKITGAFGITLATIDVSNLRLTFHSGGFVVDPSGDFDADVIVTILAGTMVVDPILGPPSTSNIAGGASPLTPVSGTLTSGRCRQDLHMPNVSLTFMFTDVPTGITATVTIVGDLTGEWTGSGVQSYCTAKAGLACGAPAIGTSGCPEAGVSSGFVVSAGPARAGKAGLLIYTDAGAAALPFQGGLLCISPAPLKRSSPIGSGGTAGGCDGVFTLDFNAFASGALGGNPLPSIQQPGTRVNAQFWGRDSQQTGSFLSDAVEFVMH